MTALHTEDAASVLESFIHDTANLPAEIAHLLEEMAAKDEALSQLRAQIHCADMTLQRHVKSKGQTASAHPSEETLQRTVSEAFTQSHVLQDEKVALANKASLLLDRHVKRLDLKIRDLAGDGSLVHDPTLPSLLHASEGNRVNPNTSGASTGVNTPQLHPYPSHVSSSHLLSNASGSSTHMANAAMAQMLNRVAHQNNMSSSVPAPAAAMQPHPLLGGGPHGGGSGRHREMSASSEGKRRRLNGSQGPVGVGASGLARHSSFGPGTPKAGTPGLGGGGTAASSRAGSAGPRTKKAATKKVPPHVASGLARRRLGSAAARGGTSSKKSRRRATTGKRDSESGDEVSSDSEEGSEEDGSGGGRDGLSAKGKDGAGDEDADMRGVDEEDTKLYCFCKKVSHGDMVACDNDNCPFEWFHWDCVGLTQEPKGRWLCPDCRKLPPKNIKYAR